MILAFGQCFKLNREISIIGRKTETRTLHKNNNKSNYLRYIYT